MKSLLLIGFVFAFTACSSLITRKELKQCSDKCGGEKQISQCHKDDSGRVVSSCK